MEKQKEHSWFERLPHDQERGVPAGGGKPMASASARLLRVATAPSKSQTQGSLAYKFAMARKHEGK